MVQKCRWSTPLLTHPQPVTDLTMVHIHVNIMHDSRKSPINALPVQFCSLCIVPLTLSIPTVHTLKPSSRNRSSICNHIHSVVIQTYQRSTLSNLSIMLADKTPCIHVVLHSHSCMQWTSCGYLWDCYIPHYTMLVASFPGSPLTPTENKKKGGRAWDQFTRDIAARWRHSNNYKSRDAITQIGWLEQLR